MNRKEQFHESNPIKLFLYYTRVCYFHHSIPLFIIQHVDMQINFTSLTESILDRWLYVYFVFILNEILFK